MSANHFLCQIRAAAEKSDEAEVLIYDDIGRSWFGDGITAKQLVKDLAAMKAALITVRINSAGGDVFEGLAIYNALRRHDALVVTEIDGLAASIASVIALAGEEVRMSDNAFFMIHEPFGMAIGDAAEMREYADLLDKVGGSLVNVYAEKTGREKSEIEDWMAAETWFDAEEAKAAGFVDKLVKGKKIEARADLSGFKRPPAALMAALGANDEDKPAAAGGAAPEPKNAPNQPADEAMEGTMSALDAAAQAAALESARAEERGRITAIRALGREHNVAQDQIDKWLDDSTVTVAHVKDQILEQIRSAASAAPKVKATVGEPRASNDPAKGFTSPRDFLMAVMANRAASSRADVSDERLRPLAMFDKDDKQAQGEMAYLMPAAFTPRSIMAAAGSDEQGAYSDTHGGFAVPKQFVPRLLQVGFEGDPTAGMTQAVPMASPQVEIPARTDKNHSSSVSGGFTVSRRPETAAIDASRMSMELVTLKATGLFGMAYATEEILSDSAVSFAAIISQGFADQFPAHVLNEKIRGTGAGEFQGVLNSPAKVSIAKENNQAADTIVTDNVIKMAARCWGLNSAIWLANHDCRPQLYKLALPIGTAGVPIYTPSGQIGFPDMLLGRPIFYTEFASTVGDEGDIMLVNWSQYLEGLYQPLQSAESVHVRFLNHERAFKFWLRNAGACWWRSPLTPAKGSNTLSPIVTLAAR